MATKKGDVELVVKARNDASKALDTIDKALSSLTDSQGDLTASSAKVSQTLEQFAKVAATVGNAYSKIQTDSDRAAAAVSRQESVLNENKAVYQSLVSQMEAAARVQDKLTQKANELAAAQTKLNRGQLRYGPPTREVSEQMQSLAAAQDDAKRGATAAAAAQEQLSRQAQRVATSVAEQEASFRKSFYVLQDLAGGADKAAAALDKVRAAQQRAGAASAEAAAKQEQSSAATMRRSALELRRSMSEAAAGAQTGWRASQDAIRDLTSDIARAGVQTTEQVADMERLRSTAAANKTAYTELRVAIELYNRVLRSQGATQQEVAAAQERARAALAGARNMMVATATAAGQAASGERSLGSAGKDAAAGTDKLDKSLQSLFANSRRSLSLFQRLRGEVLSLVSSYVGLYAAISGVNQVIQASMQMQATESRLNVVTNGDAAKTAAELTWVKNEADRLGFSLTTIAAEWSKFAVSAQASNFTMEQTRKVFTSVSEAGRVLKLDSQRLELAFNAITQMMSKGTIQMEELRQQLGEHIPGSFALMAQAAGVSGAELTKMMEKGQLTSDYLLKFADVLDKRFGPQLSKSLEMTQAEIGRFQTAMTLALNKIADAGVLDAFTKALRELQELMRSKDAEVWFQRVGAAVGGLINILMAVGRNIDLIITALVALGAAKGAAYVMSLTQAFVGLITTIRTAQTAAAGLSVVMAGIGGPVGVAIGIAAGAFAFLATRVRESETAMISAKRSIESISQAYRDGSRSAKEWADSLKGLSNLQLERDLANLKKTLKDELDDIFQPFGRSFMTRARASNSPLTPVFEELQQLADKARKGQIPLAEFKKRLDAIGEANPTLRDLALQMQDSAAKALETEDALTKFQASIRLMRGEATEADKKLLGLADATNELSDAQMSGAQAMGKYTEAMDRLAKRIPELKKEMEFNDGFKAIQQDLQAAFDNAGGDEKLKQAALDRAAKAMAALRDGYDEAMIREFANTRGDAMIKSVNLLKGFEGFRATPYWDKNAYRVGYGSDTVTLDDGSIQKVTQGITISQQDALRDLVRRIGEFQEGVKRQIGTERFGAFSPDQQAALTSIAYNYGSLPKRILDAVRFGTSEEIAAAVRGLRNDNGGINSGRRDAEAAILARESATLVASTAKQLTDREDKVTKVISDLTTEVKKAGLSKREQFIEDALKKAQPDPSQPQLTADQVTRVRDTAGQAFDAQEELSTQQKILALQQQIADSKTGISREEFIANNARKDGVNLLTEQGQKYAELQGQIYDRENAERRVNELVELRKELQEQIDFQQGQGNFEAAAGMQKTLDDVNVKLKEAIANAQQFYQAMGGANADIALAKLQNLNNSIVTTQKVTLDAKAINQQFAQGATAGFTTMAQAMAGWIDGTMSGKEALESIRDAFLKFAADFLLQIAQMILQQAIFNAISGMFGGGMGGTGGLGGMIAGLVRHDGGLASGGGTRMVSPAWFANAVRYHTGGIAGLAPNEVPAILERNEEVLTRDDPRHIMNGGGSGVNVKVVNAIDPGDFVSQGLGTEVGERAIMNFIRANSSAVKGALG